jgi:hypothetical protein
MKPNSVSPRFRSDIEDRDLVVAHALKTGRPTAQSARCRELLAEIIRRELRRPYSSGPAIARALGCSEKTVYRLAWGRR